MTYQLEFLKIDSEALGFNAWSLNHVRSDTDFQTALDSLKDAPGTKYVTCKIPVEEAVLIHEAERVGFRFAETQFSTSLRLSKNFDTTRYPYDYVRVDTEDELAQVAAIAQTTIEHDRYSRDPRIGRDASGLRYRHYLLDSFKREDDEIWATRSRSTGQLLTFRSHRKINEREVNLLIGGVHQDHKDLGLGIVSSHFCFNQLREAGYRRATTHISAANTPIVNLEIGHLSFRITNTFVVLSILLD